MYAYDWFFQALIHGKKGDKDEAIKWFDKAVDWTRQNAADNADLRRVLERSRREVG